MSAPHKHEIISLEELDNLTIKDGALYWKGKMLTTEVELRLSRTQKIVGSVLSALVAAAAIVGPPIAYLADLDNICEHTKNSLFLCPVDTAASKDGVRNSVLENEKTPDP